MKAPIEEIMAFFAPGVRGWTDEQWAEHDAKIAKAREIWEPPVGDELQRRLKNLREYGWPVRALEAALHADEEKPGIATIGKWNSDRESVLVLSGAPGCGKTTAAAWWALRRRAPFPFLRATAFAASSRYDRETRAEWFTAPALALDDLGAEYADSKGSFLTDLDELVDVFYADRRPLIITTNCTGREFVDRYGTRITDRFRECGTWVVVEGSSLRKKPEAL